MKSPSLDPRALSPEDLARVLSASGPRPVSVEQIREDLDDGVPVNMNGTVNLVHYTAWLVREVGPG